MEIGRAEIGAVRCRHEGRPPASRIVANARSLDLEDVGAKIREKLAGPGAREDAGQFEDADAFQGTRNAQNAAMPVIARPRISTWTDRKTVVEGTRVSVRVDPCGSRINKN